MHNFAPINVSHTHEHILKMPTQVGSWCSKELTIQLGKLSLSLSLSLSLFVFYKQTVALSHSASLCDSLTTTVNLSLSPQQSFSLLHTHAIQDACDIQPTITDHEQNATVRPTQYGVQLLLQPIHPILASNSPTRLNDKDQPSHCSLQILTCVPTSFNSHSCSKKCLLAF